MTDVTARIKALASKQAEWRSLSPATKFKYLDMALDTLMDEIKIEGLAKLVGEPAADMKNAQGVERDVVVTEEIVIAASFLKDLIQFYREGFRVKAGAASQEEEKLMHPPMRKVGGKVVADVFPLTEADMQDLRAKWSGELWFDPNFVKETSQVKPFQYEAQDKTPDGIHVILGAGNYTILAVSDALHGLFIRNRTVFVKAHPLRGFADDLMRALLAPLYEDGYLYSERDQGLARTNEIIRHPMVSTIHMTGGKATHDNIVWGSSLEEQNKNKANHTPKLTNAKMTSELGCVTPYIMTPVTYTPEELSHQAQVLLSARWINGGASCNAPQVVVVGKSWGQRQEFCSLLEENWAKTPAVPTYYPGSAGRWNAFKKAYPNSAKIVYGTGLDKTTVDPTHLPLLLVNIAVDLNTPEGCAKLKKEYAIRNEAFSPVVIVATVDDTGVEDFMSKACDLCNNYMFGTLSCSLAVPDSSSKIDPVEKAIADLKYGCIMLNAWSAQSYGVFRLNWSGHPSEKIENIESGIGSVCNAMAFEHIEKSVCRTPTVDPNHFIFCKSNEENIEFLTFVSKMVMGVPQEV